MKLKTSTEEEWRQMGKMAYEVRDKLQELIRFSSGRLPSKDLDKLIKIEHIIDAWRSNAEEEMWKRTDTHDTSVFYRGNI